MARQKTLEEMMDGVDEYAGLLGLPSDEISSDGEQDPEDRRRLEARVDELRDERADQRAATAADEDDLPPLPQAKAAPPWDALLTKAKGQHQALADKVKQDIPMPEPEDHTVPDEERVFDPVALEAMRKNSEAAQVKPDDWNAPLQAELESLASNPAVPPVEEVDQPNFEEQVQKKADGIQERARRPLAVPPPVEGRKPKAKDRSWDSILHGLQGANMRAQQTRAGDDLLGQMGAPGWQFRASPGKYDAITKAAELPLEMKQARQRFQAGDQGLAAGKLKNDQEAAMTDPASPLSARVRDSVKAMLKDSLSPEQMAALDKMSAKEVKEFVMAPELSLARLARMTANQDAAKAAKEAAAKAKADAAKAKGEAGQAADKNVRDAIEASGLYDGWIQKQKDAGTWDSLTAKELKQLLSPVETDRQLPGKVQVAVAGAAGKHEDEKKYAQTEGIPAGWESVPGYTPTNETKKTFFSEVLPQVNTTRSAVQRLKKALSESSKLGKFTDEKARTNIRSIVQEIKDKLRVVEQFGVPSGKDMEQIANRIGDPTEMSFQNFMTDTETQLRALDNALNAKLEVNSEGKFRPTGSSGSKSKPKNPFLE